MLTQEPYEQKMKNQKAIIDIRNVHTRFGNHQVLNGIDLQIYPEETFVILGRSGCGKSTLLRHLVGLQKPDSGEIYIKGVNLINAREREKQKALLKVGMLFQNGALFNSMTVGENVALPLRQHTALEASTIRIMGRIKLDLVGLADFEHHYPAQLSGGMKKRAALARALAMDPEILFCDEPSAGLDPIVAKGIDHLILKLRRAFKMSIIVVTHELESVFTIADRIALMDGGEIVFLGTREEMKASKNRMVRQFIDRKPDQDVINTEKYLNTLINE